MHLSKSAVLVTFISILVIAAFIAGLSFTFNKQLNDIKRTQKENGIENVRTNQFLLSTINWSTQRQKTILFMRDKIIEEWVRIGYPKNFDKAYQKAETIMRECERYPGLKPFLLLAVNCVESCHLDSLTDSAGKKTVLISPQGAIGSWQFMESSARLLCDGLGISYSDRVFTDVPISTRMAAKYFDVLAATYDNDTASVADYNGGPRQAEYYMHNQAKLSEETKKFVPDVLNKMEAYNEAFLTYKVEKTILSR